MAAARGGGGDPLLSSVHLEHATNILVILPSMYNAVLFVWTAKPGCVSFLRSAEWAVGLRPKTICSLGSMLPVRGLGVEMELRRNVSYFQGLSGSLSKEEPMERKPLNQNTWRPAQVNPLQS